MADEWNDDCNLATTMSSSMSISNGRSISAGRGQYSAFESGIEDNHNGDRSYGRGRGGRARGTRGGGRGEGRGGRSDYRGGRDGDDNNEERNNGESGYRGRGGGRGGRGGGRGADGNEEHEKPREIYIPQEVTDDLLFQNGITSGKNFDNLNSINVKVSGQNAPVAIETFQHSGLRQIVLENVAKSNYTKPTPIQKRAIPIILAGRDLMGCAQTGSGKTAAFLLPIISKLIEDQSDVVVQGRCAQPQVIIMSPTRELSIQIHSEARKFAHGSMIKTCLAYGGTAVQHQAQNIGRGCHILTATAGRLLDFVERKYISFDSVKYVVLDEADRMLDMGFMSCIEKVMRHPSMVPMEQRQTIMFSATFPDNIQQLAAQFLNDYIFVTIGVIGGACSDVEQIFYELKSFDKKPKLKEIICENEQTLIFVEFKRNADFLAGYIAESMNFKSTSIHGDRLQRERETALNDFKTGRCNILVATAVAARGLDINGVAHVINFDLPKNIEEYVHRIGRTGRVGNRGKASSIFNPNSDCALAGDLVRILEQAGQNVPSFLETYAGKGTFREGEFGADDIRDMNEGNTLHATDNFDPEEIW